MKMMRLVAVAAVAVLVSVGAQAEETKDYAKLILGKWEASKADEGTLPVGSTVEFLKGGKIKISIKAGDNDMAIEGTYKLQGDKFELAMKIGDDEHKQTIYIKKLTATELSTADKDGKAVVLTKKK